MSTTPSPTLSHLAALLKTQQTSSVRLTTAALENIAASEKCDGQAVFIDSNPDRALHAAHASDQRRASGTALSVIDGLPISVKDLFDVKGEVTRAGSNLLRDAPPATQDAPVITRLLEAGAVLVGRTNMTEFAFSGVGINPHYGTPANPWDPKARRITGGSSSGAAASVAGAMAVAAIGSDTGGSVRIPAALCGLTGFKPTARRVPMQGTFPLAPSLDSIGPIAMSVECCAILDGILSGHSWDQNNPQTLSLKERRFAIPSTVVLDELEPGVEQAFNLVIEKIRATGAVVDIIPIPEFAQWQQINQNGGLVCAEAWQWHQAYLPEGQDKYDPLVLSRIQLGKDMSPLAYQGILEARARWINAVESRIARYDALLLPTVPITAPCISSLQNNQDEFFRINRLLLRNTNLINFLDGCALSIPCHPAQTAPVGLMIAASQMHDVQLLHIGRALESLLSS